MKNKIILWLCCSLFLPISFVFSFVYLGCSFDKIHYDLFLWFFLVAVLSMVGIFSTISFQCVVRILIFLVVLSFGLAGMLLCIWVILEILLIRIILMVLLLFVLFVLLRFPCHTIYKFARHSNEKSHDCKNIPYFLALL